MCCRGFLDRVAGLMTDKQAELRRVAADALCAAYSTPAREALLGSILSASPSVQLTLRQALCGALPDLDAELQQASMAHSLGISLSSSLSHAGSPSRQSHGHNPPSPGAYSRSSQGSMQSLPASRVPPKHALQHWQDTMQAAHAPAQAASDPAAHGSSQGSMQSLPAPRISSDEYVLAAEHALQHRHDRMLASDAAPDQAASAAASTIPAGLPFNHSDRQPAAQLPARGTAAATSAATSTARPMPPPDHSQLGPLNLHETCTPNVPPTHQPKASQSVHGLPQQDRAIAAGAGLRECNCEQAGTHEHNRDPHASSHALVQSSVSAHVVPEQEPRGSAAGTAHYSSTIGVAPQVNDRVQGGTKQPSDYRTMTRPSEGHSMAGSQAAHPRIVVTSQPLLQATLQGALPQHQIGSAQNHLQIQSGATLQVSQHHYVTSNALPESHPHPHSDVPSQAQAGSRKLPGSSWPVQAGFQSESHPATSEQGPSHSATEVSWRSETPGQALHVSSLDSWQQPDHLNQNLDPAQRAWGGPSSSSGPQALSNLCESGNAVRTGDPHDSSHRQMTVEQPNGSSYPGPAVASDLHPAPQRDWSHHRHGDPSGDGAADATGSFSHGSEGLSYGSRGFSHSDGGGGHGGRQPLAAKQGVGTSGDYSHLLPLSPISNQRMPGQENAGPGATNSSKQQAPAAPMQSVSG